MRKLLAVPFLFLLPVLPAAGAEKPPAPELETGKVIRKVVTRHDPGQSYALYLPRNYDPKKKWPILYGFSPGARGVSPVHLFRRAAEKYGWILAGSNNSRNGPWEPIAAAIKAMIKDTEARLSIDKRRRYSTGFSGGARVAFYLAAGAKPPFAGVVPIGAGMSSHQKPPAKGSRLVVFALCGTSDFNHGELLRLERRLGALGLRSRMETFKGGHGWAPADRCGAALRYMELIWRLDAGGRETDAVRKMLALERADAGKLLAGRGQYLRGYARLEELAALFKDTEGGRKLAARAAEVKASGRHGRELAALAALEKLDAGLAKVADRGKRLEKLVSLGGEFVKGRAGTDAAVRVQVRIDAVGMQLAMSAHRLMRMKRYEEAARYLARARGYYPKDATIAYNLACAQARSGKKKAAVGTLAESVKLGFKGLDWMKKDPDLDSLRAEPGYRKLIEALEAGPREEPPFAL